MLIDTHTHLYSEAFEEDRKVMIQRAVDQGVQRFFIPAIDSGYTESMYELERQFPERIHLMMGLHPCSIKANYKEELAHVMEQFAARHFCAVGEIGIDLYWDTSTLEIQKDAFRTQIRLAKDLGLPIVIHCRDAFQEIFDVLEEEKDEKLYGIFHCFTGTLEDAYKAIGFNMKLGIGGVVTFKNGKIDQFLDQIDLKHIVLETDSPYLAPVPYRGKRNESAYLAIIAQKVAEIYGKPVNEIAAITSANAMEIFKT